MKRAILILVSAAFVFLPAAAWANPTVWRLQGWKTDFTKTTVSFDEIISGGPPRDGIPPIDEPTFKPTGEITDIAGREPVIVYPLDKSARAYPLRVLMWHEIVNDTVDGRPVAVTYCPLCNASIVFDRRVDGRVLDFGTTGLLRKSDLVMWDRQTESWWQQFSGKAIVGELTGASLKLLPSQVMSFEQYRTRWPAGRVLVPTDPSFRQYGRNPYTNYEDAQAPFLYRGKLPQGIAAMGRVVIARHGDKRPAVSLAHLSERREVTLQGVTFRWRPGQASALGASEIAKGKDVGTVEVVDKNGEPIVHDITFAFVFSAFVEDAAVLTDKGLVRLATGEVLER